jgi:hypothetical protein
MKRSKNSIPVSIQTEVVDGSESSSSFTCRRGVVMNKRMMQELEEVYSTSYAISVVDDRIKVDFHSEYPVESQTEFNEKHSAQDNIEATPSVKNEIARKDHLKWMLVFSWMAKCLVLEVEEPMCHQIPQKHIVAKAFVKSAHGVEIKRLGDHQNISDFRLFVQNGLVCFFVDVK